MDQLTRELLTEAANEITRLRKENARLSAYMNHTERMLSLFEGVPPREPSQGESVDIVWLIRSRLEDHKNDAVRVASEQAVEK